MKDNKTIVERLLANADIDEMEGCTAYVVAMEREAAERIKELENQLKESNKVIETIDGIISAKGRYHTAQWYQKMVSAFDEHKKHCK